MAEREAKSKPIRDFVNRPPAPPTSEEVKQKRRKLWDAINEFVRQHGAWVTSLPYKSAIRIECIGDSTLPTELIRLGYSPRQCGVGTRIIAGRTARIVSVDIIEITLGR
jgi:hypothetical protein